MRDCGISRGRGISRNVVVLIRRREEVQWNVVVVLLKVNTDLNETSSEFFNFLDAMLVTGVIIIIIIVAICVVTIDVVDLSDELTNALVLAQRSERLLLGVVGRLAILLVTNDAAQVVSNSNMVVLVVVITAVCVAVTSTLSTILAVDKMSVDGMIFRCGLFRQRRVKIRY